MGILVNIAMSWCVYIWFIIFLLN